MRNIVFILFFAAGSLFAQTPKLYIGGKFGLGPTMLSNGVVLGGNLNTIQIDWQPTESLALETGMGFYFGPKTKHNALKQTDTGSGIIETYSGMETRIVFPLLLK